ncbi:MAG: GH3 auxin-responsive promoter family protein [Silvanigrellales bacterium]|nr:GH3 auxin-responsive promoter family protein [Silvanigrellales bacterium]
MRRLTESALSHALLAAARLAEGKLQSSLLRTRDKQEKALSRCLRAMEGSPVRQRHGVALSETPSTLRKKGIRTEISEFQELIHGGNFKPSYFSREGVVGFAISSGTSSATPKLFPLTREYVRALDRMQRSYFMHRLALAGNPRLSLGHSFMITALDLKTTHAGLPVNPMSRILYDLFKEPPLSFMRIRHMSECFDEVTLELKPDARLDDIRDLRMHSLFGMPPFVLMIFERLQERFGISSLRDVWPHLAFYGHSGFNVTPYRDRLQRILGHDVFFFDGYAASEAVMGLQFDATSSDLTFLPHDTFFEFLCQRTGDRLHLHELREGDAYELLITTPGGLLCYPLGDIVQVTSVSPVRFVVQGRMEESLRLTGEQVNAAQVANALHRACELEHLKSGNFVVAPRNDAVGYEVFLELAKNRESSGAFDRTQRPWEGHDTNCGQPWSETPASKRLSALFDAQLRAENSVYGLMRSSALLHEPRIVPLQAGSLDEVMLQGKRFGQGKYRRLYSSRADIESRLGELTTSHAL